MYSFTIIQLYFSAPGVIARVGSREEGAAVDRRALVPGREV
jgi:hypothetical protein